MGISSYKGLTLVEPISSGASLLMDNYKELADRVGPCTSQSSLPTINDDVTAGFYKYSKWIDLTTDSIYVCIDNTVGAAIWKKIDFDYNPSAPNDNDILKWDDTGSSWYPTSNTLLDLQDVIGVPNDGDVLAWDTSSWNPVAHAVPPATTTDNAIVRWNGLDGRAIKDSDVILDDNENVSGVDSITYDISPTLVPAAEGVTAWNSTDHTLDIQTGIGPILQVGQESYTIIYNDTGSLITNGTVLYQKNTVVSGRITVGLANATTHEQINGEIFVATMDIPDGQEGIVTQLGRLRGLNTSTFNEGDQLWVDTTDGQYTSTRPSFPNYAIKIGRIAVKDVANGEITVYVKGSIDDTVINFFNGIFRETIDFSISESGGVVTGSLEPANGHDNTTMIFSDGFTMLDTNPPATIVLTPGTDTVPQKNYIYIPQSTKVLTLSTSDWPVNEHIKVAFVILQSAVTTGVYGALLNEVYTDDIQDTTLDQGHLSHIVERMRYDYVAWIDGVQATATIVSTIPDDVYISVTSGNVYQLHKSAFPALDTQTGDFVSIVNDSVSPYKYVGNLNAETLDANGDTLANKSFSFVLWGIVNPVGQTSHLMINLPSSSYAKNQPDTAVSDPYNYSIYSFPAQFKCCGFLIARFTFTLDSGGTDWVLYDTEDLRGYIPNTTAGGGAGGAGVTTFTALTDTPSAYTGEALNLVQVNVGESALEFTGTPTILDFTNAQHDHSDASNGGYIAGGGGGGAFTADGDYSAYQGADVDAGAGANVGSLAQGSYATASGNFGSFAQGTLATASGSIGSFAQGNTVISSGHKGSFAQGLTSTSSSSVGSFAQGELALATTTTKTLAGNSVDIGTEIITLASHGLTTGDAVVFDTTSNGVVAGTVYYAKVLSANTFTLHTTIANLVANTKVNLTGTPIGGTNLIAGGQQFAQGATVNATGRVGAFAQGVLVNATGNRGSFAQGYKSTASGYDGSFAQGESTASGINGSFAQGFRAIASNNSGTFAQGQISTASGMYGSFAQGNAVTASGSYGSFAQGFYALASQNDGSFAQGYQATASGAYGSFAQGINATASGSEGSFAQGNSAHATGYVGSFAQGGNTIASGGAGSFAQGLVSIAAGHAGSFAQGHSTETTVSTLNITANSVDTGTDVVTLAGHPFTSGDSLMFDTSGNGVDKTIVYFTKYVSGTEFTLHTSIANMLVNTKVDLSGDLPGTNVIYGGQQFAQGAAATASGRIGVFAQGVIATSSGSFGAMAQGQNVISSGSFGAFSQGYNVTSSGGVGSFAQGDTITASGSLGCFAQGAESIASGTYGSFAQGLNATASGDNGCFAQGNTAKAINSYGVFAQSNATASGSRGCFAQGDSATALGYVGSFSQGADTVASGGAGSFSQGIAAIAAGHAGSFAQGNDAVTTVTTLNITANSVDTGTNVVTLAGHPFTSGDSVMFDTSGNGIDKTFVYFIKWVSGTQFSLHLSIADMLANTKVDLTGDIPGTNVIYGGQQFAQGAATTASGRQGAFAQGVMTTASGNWGSFAQGENLTASGSWGSFAQGYAVTSSGGTGSFAQGDTAVASGDGSFAQGGGVYATGTSGSFAQGGVATASGNIGSFAQGNTVLASGIKGSFAQGNAVTASGSQGSFAQGTTVTASGHYGSFAQGNTAIASGSAGAFAQGINVTASGVRGAFAQGTFVTASGNYGSFAQGTATKALGSAGSWAQGVSTTASGSLGSFAQGDGATASGAKGSFAQGTGATASGINGSFAQGLSVIASGSNGSFAQGYNATASGANGSFAKGNNVTASGTSSWAIGLNTVANKKGQHATAMGRFASDGDAQVSQFVLRRQVTHSDANWYELFLDGSAAQLTIAANTCWAFTALITGATTGMGKSFAFEIKGLIENDGGTTTIKDRTITAIDDADDPSFDVRPTADNANDVLAIEVSDSDAASDTVRWVCSVKTVELTYA